MKTIKIKDYSQIPKDFTGIIEESNGSKHSFLNGKYHRETGPAYESITGTKMWYLNGKLHRENDLPAIEYSDGYKVWCLNGLRHRKTGPAVEWADGRKEWYYCGEWQFSFEEVQKIHQERIMNPNIIL